MNNFLFGIYPYIAITVMVMASIIRYDRDPFTWKSKSSQLLRKRQFVAGSVLFHVGVLMIFFGHLIGLLTPIQIFDFMGISHGAKQILAVVLGGVAGAMALVGGLLLLHRRLFDPRIRANSTLADTGIMVLLMAQLLLGLATIVVSLKHLDGHEMVKFMNWAQGILMLKPGVSALVADVHVIFKLHLLLGMTLFLVFPFTRLVHIWSAPVWYLGRRGYQIVRTRKGSPAGRGAAAKTYTVQAKRPS